MTPERWQEVERLYHAAQERDGKERAAFLEGACREDEGLRREVESLLAYQGEAKDFIETPAGKDLRTPIETALRRHEKAVPGQCAGRVFGVYQLKSWIAAGGMGEVYRAVDTRLNRTVAIKILPEHLSNDPDRQQRFRREANVISSLNHPHICTLYDIGVEGGVDFLVMEYIDGETLEKRLTGGPLPLKRALEYAIQILDALDKAHRCGVIHRDLKPANIMLTGSGVKLLDFGLATRLTASGTGTENQSAEKSESLPGSGIVRGTPEYSSPEQLQGKPIDARTDIFSFGATAFEMITGQRAFPGESTAAVVKAILDEDPRPLRELVPDLPASIERTLFRCLSKNPDERWQTTNDLLFELRSIASASADSVVHQPRRVPLRVERVLWVAGLVALSVAVFLWGRRNGVPEGAVVRETPGLRLPVYPAQGTDFHAGYDVPFALSPDGHRIVYVAVRSDGTRQLWLRRLSSDTELAEPMQGTEGANSPFWAPNSEWVGFFASNSLKTIRVSTGVVQSVAPNVSTMAGAAWNADNVIVFPGGSAVLLQVSTLGGPVSKVATKGDGSYFWPQFLADGKHYLYADTVAREIRLGSLASEAPRTLMKFPVRPSSLAYVPGYVFFVQDATLFARPFDEKRLEFSGEPIRLLDGIPVTAPGRAPFSVSPTGLLAYWTYPGGTPAVLRWFERDGRTSAAVDTLAKYVGFSLSPDGRRAVVSRRADDGGANLWVRDLARGTEDQFTFDGAAYTPQWSADGARIVFTGPGRTPPPKLFIKSFAEKSLEGPIGSVSMPNFASAWSRDGESIISVRMDPANGNDLWVERLPQHAAERLSVNTPSNESQGKLSPDDQWIAYVTDESGKDEVWVASFPAGDNRRQVSIGGGTSPEWGAEGREVFYVSTDKRLMAVPLRTGQRGVEPDTPHPLFSVGNLVETEQRVMPTSNSYAVTVNGQRFLVAVRVRDPRTPPIVILVNWRSLLKQ